MIFIYDVYVIYMVFCTCMAYRVYDMAYTSYMLQMM